MTSTPATDARLFQQATDWFMRVRAVDATSDDHAAWLEWIETDPAHRAAFDQVLDIWSAAGAMDFLPWPTAAELARTQPEDFACALADAAAARPSAECTPRHRRLRPTWRWTGAGLAAGLLLVALQPPAQPLLARAWYDLTYTASQRIATGHDELRIAQLPDGSRIHLGADTAVRLNFTPQQRLVEAAEGEVFYRVKHDIRRPFVVEAGPVTVTAVGTAFAVRREAGTVSVTVTDGAVDVRAAEGTTGVTPLRVKAGQRAWFDRGMLTARIEQSGKSTATVSGRSADWRRGQLRFDDEPLRVVVASLNRYADKPIVLSDPSIGELHFTGTVFEDRSRDWLNAVPRLFPVAVEETPDHILLKPR